MEHSTIHIKAPHEVHIGAKVMAARRRTSMNQYVIDLIEADMKGNELDKTELAEGIEIIRKATPKQKKVLDKAVEVFEELGVEPDKKKVEKISKQFCEHFQLKGQCLTKGCKYA